jgi:hypothetical protein
LLQYIGTGLKKQGEKFRSAGEYWQYRIVKENCSKNEQNVKVQFGGCAEIENG